ncbi:MAG TPA: GcrA family cell cycle regulator, partial [Caulobacteraceae bacterium]|nr:GcrA family cell cycle regulator [Caulobacteraceae bacterium]
APRPVYREEAPGSATVLTLGAHMCKWPIGDPSSDTFTFCGKRAGEGAPYCTDHARIAYQPQQTGKKKTGANELARSLRRYI